MKIREKLKEKYREEISSWQWDKITDDTDLYYEEDFFSDEKIARKYLATCFEIFPSGKYYVPWSSNATDRDIIRDSIFVEELEAQAMERGCFVDYDGSDIFIVFTKTNDED